jgi:uncharacterized protein YndB with AHSA1/START domain
MTGGEGAGNRILGALRSQDGKGVVTVQDRFDTDIDDLWSAITDPERLARWHGRVEGDLRPGGEFRLSTADLDSAGRVEVCDPPQRLVVTTRETDESATSPGVSAETLRRAGPLWSRPIRTWPPVSARHRPLRAAEPLPASSRAERPLAGGVEPRFVQWQDFEVWKQEPGSPGCAMARPRNSP